jgi:predicted O-methyltransferase YrrM
MSQQTLRHLLGRQSDSFNVLEVAFLTAALESALYYEKRMRSAPAFDNKFDLLSHAIQLAKSDGLFLEFGVAAGETINHIAMQIDKDRRVFGFDSFTGLPETWRTGFVEGNFAQSTLPTVPDQVTLIKGLFDDTLPAFLETNLGPVAFLHIDCDLYSSTKSLLKQLAPRFCEGTIIVFDEYFNFPGWQQDEYKAFQELVADCGLIYDYIGFVPSDQQAAVCITKKQNVISSTL